MWASGYSHDVPAFEGIKCVKMLLNLGAKINLKDNRGWTAMMIASSMGHAEIVDVLLKAGADPLIRSVSGKTAFQLAQESGHSDIIKIFKTLNR